MPRLLLVTDGRRARLPLPDLVTAAVAGGVDAVYLRDVAPAALLAVVAELRARIGPEVTLLTNGGPDAAGAARIGLHLRERDMTAAEARAILGPDALIGKSVHAAAGAAPPGADYLLAGHVYASTSKPGRPPLGREGLAAIVAAASCPVLAIGGITAERVAEVEAAGARGVAVIGAIAAADDPRIAAIRLRDALAATLTQDKEQDMPEQFATIVAITVNGKPTEVPEGATIHDFLASRRMTDAMAIVERNGEIVPRAAYGETALAAGDVLEVVHAVGGG